MEVITTPEKHSYREVGELLRKARESLRIPLDNAARMLHIRMRYLDAMEQGRIEDLPGLPYARGYLQSYATFLGLDKDEILRRFEDIEKSIAASAIYFPQILNKQKTPSASLIWGGLAAAFVMYALWNVISSRSNERISMLEAFPSPKMQISASLVRDVACLKPQEEVYPPCIVVKEPGFRVSPWPEKINSVMELSENN